MTFWRNMGGRRNLVTVYLVLCSLAFQTPSLALFCMLSEVWGFLLYIANKGGEMREKISFLFVLGLLCGKRFFGLRGGFSVALLSGVFLFLIVDYDAL